LAPIGHARNYTKSRNLENFCSGIEGRKSRFEIYWDFIIQGLVIPNALIHSRRQKPSIRVAQPDQECSGRC